MSMNISPQDNEVYCSKHNLLKIEVIDGEEFTTYPFDLNMANSNFGSLMKALGITIDWEFCCGTLHPIEVINAIKNMAPELAVRQRSDTRVPGRCRVLDIGIDQEYVERRLSQLLEIANECIRRGVKLTYA